MRSEAGPEWTAADRAGPSSAATAGPGATDHPGLLPPPLPAHLAPGQPPAIEGFPPSPDRPKPKLWRSRRYRGIECFCGVPGSGKTYELARWGLEQQKAGREVWCSYGFSIPGARTFRSIDEFVSIPSHAAVCVDEAPIWFDARAWKNMDPVVLVRLTQIRHYDIHLRYTAIEPTMVELRLRQITFKFIEHRPLLGPFNLRRRLQSPEGAPKLHDDHGPFRLRRMRPDVCLAYDTTADADTSDWVGRSRR